jgi:hypothetical protein
LPWHQRSSFHLEKHQENHSHYSVRKIMCTPLSVSTMPDSSPTFKANLRKHVGVEGRGV